MVGLVTGGDEVRFNQLGVVVTSVSIVIVIEESSSFANEWEEYPAVEVDLVLVSRSASTG